MTANQLLTREAFLRDIFNKAVIPTDDVKVFLMYFGGILQLGIGEGLIDEARRNAIANAITNAIEVKTRDDDDDDYETNYVQIKNYMYVLNSYLQSKSNWDAWLELSKIESQSDAISLLRDSQNWLMKMLSTKKAYLTAIKLKVEKLGLNNVTQAYKLLLTTMNEFMTCTSDITKFDLQNYHYGVFGLGTYVLMRNEDREDIGNFCINFCDIIYNFFMEVSIMSKINAKELVANKTNESEGYFDNEIKQIDAVNNFYEEKLAMLKEKYNKDLQDCYDRVDVEDRYFKAKSELKQEWEKKLEKLEKMQSQALEFQIEVLGGDYSLKDLIKEYAVFGLAKKGEIQYPSTIVERSAVLMRIDMKQAIDEFISLNRHLLKEEQIAYLTKIAGN